MSAFYQLQASDVPAGMNADAESAYVIWTDGTVFYIQTAQDPHPLEGVIPAMKIGSSWQAFWDGVPQAVRDAVFLCTIEREIDGVYARMRIPRAQVLVTDIMVRAAIAPHRFSGEYAEAVMTDA